MVLPVIGALASAIPSIFRTIQGARQMREGKRGLAGLERPVYQMPEEVQRQLALSGAAYADPTIPGQSMMTDQTTQATANAVAASREAGNPFATISSLQANQQASMQNIGVQAANFQENQRSEYMQQLQQVAGYRDTEFQMNEFAPYAQKFNEYRDMIGAGNKNLYSGIEGMSGAAINVMSGISAGAFNKNSNVGNDRATQAMQRFRGDPGASDSVTPASSGLGEMFGKFGETVTSTIPNYIQRRSQQQAVSALGGLGGMVMPGAAGASGGFINNNAPLYNRMPNYSGFGGVNELNNFASGISSFGGGIPSTSGYNLGNPNIRNSINNFAPGLSSFWGGQ